MTHELGHAVGLEHSHDAASVMYESLATGTARRSLTDADLAPLDHDHESNEPHALRAAGAEPHVCGPSCGHDLVRVDPADAGVIERMSPLNGVSGPVIIAEYARVAGKGSDVLLAGDGDDLQLGSRGRDVLIGGLRWTTRVASENPRAASADIPNLASKHSMMQTELHELAIRDLLAAADLAERAVRQ